MFSKKKFWLDLHGAIKTKKKVDFKKLRKQFEKEMSKKLCPKSQ